MIWNGCVKFATGFGFGLAKQQTFLTRAICRLAIQTSAGIFVNFVLVAISRSVPLPNLLFAALAKGPVQIAHCNN
jgi:hypothetical protein